MKANRTTIVVVPVVALPDQLRSQFCVGIVSSIHTLPADMQAVVLAEISRDDADGDDEPTVFQSKRRRI